MKALADRVVTDMMIVGCECCRMVARSRTQAHDCLDGLLRVREQLAGLIESPYCPIALLSGAQNAAARAVSGFCAAALLLLAW